MNHIAPAGIIPCPPPTSKNFHDISGRRFGRLLVQGYYGKRRGTVSCYTCLCDCGTVKIIQRDSLVSGTTMSCGCYRSEFVAKNNSILRRTHGQSETSTYRSWVAMIQRCYNPKSASYKRYGKRGITVCDRWRESFENFYADMEDCPSGLTVERRNNNLNYCPENCCWDTPKVQARNRSNNRLATLNGVTMCVSAWEERLGFKPAVLSQRLRKGWSVEKTLTTPLLRVRNKRPAL